jgi:hypothetical protein
MIRLVAFLLLLTPLSLQADDLLKSATDTLKGSADGTATVPATLDFSDGLSNALAGALGVSSKQADGGLGSLFSLAETTLGNEQFKTLAKSVPGMGDLLDAAPSLDSNSLSGMASGLGGYGEAMKGASEVYAQFQQLGLSTSAIPQYIEVTNAYLQSTGGRQAVDLFSKGVASLL